MIKVSDNKPPSKGRSLSDTFKDIAQKAQNFVDESQTKYTSDTKSSTSSTKRSGQRWYERPSTNPSQEYYRVWSWFWVIIITFFAGLFFFFLALSSPKFWFVAILIIIAVIAIIFYSITQMIPQITIFGWTIFDRSKLSARQQLSAGTRILRIFTREFIREAPAAAFFIFLFIVLIIISIVFALVSK